jgi:hypothetical protein
MAALLPPMPAITAPAILPRQASNDGNYTVGYVAIRANDGGTSCKQQSLTSTTEQLLIAVQGLPRNGTQRPVTCIHTTLFTNNVRRQQFSRRTAQLQLRYYRLTADALYGPTVHTLQYTMRGAVVLGELPRRNYITKTVMLMKL